MVKSSDKILSVMQKSACTEDIFFDLPAHVSLLCSLDFWRNYDHYKNEHKTFFFSQIILNPKFFSKNDRSIAEALYISEKSVRNYRKEFKDLFLQKYEYAKTLDAEALLSIRNTMLMFLGNEDLLSFIKDDQPDCLSSRVVQFFSGKQNNIRSFYK